VVEGLSAERLAEIERLTEAATAGPWHEGFYDGLFGFYADPDDTGEPRAVVEPWSSAHPEDNDEHGDLWLVCNPDDSKFMVEARSAVPELLAEVKRLTAERDSAREQYAGTVEYGVQCADGLVSPGYPDLYGAKTLCEDSETQRRFGHSRASCGPHRLVQRLVGAWSVVGDEEKQQ